MTGSYFIFVKMTNQNEDSVTFSYGFVKNEPEKLSGYIIEDRELQTEGKTTNTIQVIYSNDEENEI